MKTKTGSFSVKAKNAIRLTCFLLIFCVLFSLLTFIFRPNLAEGIHLKQYDTLQDNSLDMIYIGGSVCIVSWMPYEAWNEFGFTSYDVGISSLLAYNFQPLLDEALMLYQGRALYAGNLSDRELAPMVRRYGLII